MTPAAQESIPFFLPFVPAIRRSSSQLFVDICRRCVAKIRFDHRDENEDDDGEEAEEEPACVLCHSLITTGWAPFLSPVLPR